MADHHNGMDVPARKESNCVRCRNHGLKITLRGHKQYCPYATCSCDKCRFTAEQQRQMRLQNAIRRAETHVPKRQRHSAPPTMVPMSSHQQQSIVVTVENNASEQRNGLSQGRFWIYWMMIIIIIFFYFDAITFFTLIKFYFTFVLECTRAEDKKMLFDCSSELLKKFRYTWEMMPIMYALAKYANGNIDEILQRIDEGTI
jgi:DM DNA binding domain/Doublesex dimerisation domain